MSLCLSHYLSFSFFFCIRTRMRQIPWSMLYVSSSIRRSTNHVKICWFNKSLDEWCPSRFLFLAPLQECWILPCSPSCRKRESGKVEEKGQREKWQRERRGERERFFSSLAVVKRELAERLEVLRDRCLPFKALSPAGERNVASMEFMRPSRRAPLKALCDPVHTCTQDSSRLCAHTYRKLCDVIDLPIYQFLFCQSRPPSFSSPVWSSVHNFFSKQMKTLMNWVNNQFLWHWTFWCL